MTKNIFNYITINELLNENTSLRLLGGAWYTHFPFSFSEKIENKTKNMFA